MPQGTSVARPRVIVTRPQPEADEWVARLAEHGLQAMALPLLEIAQASQPADQQAAALARLQWQNYGAIMLVSGNAARFFFDQKLVLALDLQASPAIKTRVWTPGPGTARVAQQLGIPATLIDQPAPDAGQFDSEALWAQVAAQVPDLAHNGRRVLVVRGASEDAATAPGGQGREWLGLQLQAAGVAVDFVAVYERRAPLWTAAQQASALQALRDGSVWLLSSSEAVMHLRNKFPASAFASARAIATHARIVRAAQEAGFIHVKPCRPALADVVASVESLL